MESLSSRYRQAFQNNHTVLPVVHVESADQAKWNARVARGCPAAGPGVTLAAC
jgi:hypothetical protein